MHKTIYLQAGFSMMKIFLCPILFVLSCSISASVIFNTGVEFKKTILNWDTLSSTEQEQKWEIFESKNQSIYDEIIYRKGSDGWEERVNKKRKVFFEQLPLIRNDMINLFNNAEEIVTKEEKLFRRHFPDLKNDIPVYLLPSMFSFNGMAIEIPGKNEIGLLLGLDSIIARNDNLDILFSHEFFHIYHINKLSKEQIWKTFATPLWLEGFATFVSGQLNPNANNSELLMDSGLAKKCDSKEFVAKKAKEYLQIIDKTESDPNSDLLYTDWFTMSGTQKPARAGYCLGLLVLRKLATQHQVDEMSSWGEEAFTAFTKQVLLDFSNGL